MKAIVVREFGGPEVLKLEEVPTPKPAPGQVLVRIHAAGVNPYDTYMRAGTYAVKPPLPYTPGSDGAGVVEAVGDGVRTVKPGDRVYTAKTVTGAYRICPRFGGAGAFPTRKNQFRSGGRGLGSLRHRVPRSPPFGCSTRFRNRSSARCEWRCRHSRAPDGDRHGPRCLGHRRHAERPRPSKERRSAASFRSQQSGLSRRNTESDERPWR